MPDLDTKGLIEVDSENELSPSAASAVALLDPSKIADIDLNEIKNDLVRRMAEKARKSTTEMYGRHSNVHSNNVA